MALTEKESADKHTSTSRRMQREADIQPPSGGRRTQPIMSESVGKASLVLPIAPSFPYCLTTRLCGSRPLLLFLLSTFEFCWRGQRETAAPLKNHLVMV